MLQKEPRVKTLEKQLDFQYIDYQQI